MERANRLSGLKTLVMLVLCVTAILSAVALMGISSAADKRACVEKAQAQYPALPVSAFLTRDKTAVGPLKVSFAAERTRAVKKCD
ncbi:MAG: hypothetical protein QOD53_1311 [Thermoleophilaceae bacterium]|jgi:hypothetical protein|nr:hypothetical protein [Thermoleophilaceae bacterium]